MDDHSQSTEQFWNRVDEAHARELVASVTSAASAYVEYSQAWSTSKRAVALLGANAGREYELRAEMYYRTHLQQLRRTKQALARFAEALDEDGKTRITELLKGEGLKDLTASVRQRTILALVHSALSTDEAQRVVSTLDANLSRVEGLTSWQEIYQYLNQHLDELLTRKIGEDRISEISQWCLLILIITSLYAALIVVALLLFVLFLGQVAFDAILNSLEESACARL